MTGRLLLLSVALAALLVAPGGARSTASQPALTNLHAVTADSLEGAPAIRTPASASATWCGTATTDDRVPNVVAGYPVHWVYAIPSDAADRLSTYASVMQTDAEAIDAWWRREDAARAPRNDLRQLSCGAQLDLTSLRFQLPGSALDSEFDFGAVLDLLAGAGFDSELTKYVVYYDGPVADDDLCGLGGSLGGIGLAIVYVRSCLGVSTAAVAAHELLHSLGAVPDQAPNGCFGHVCPESDDLMSETIGGGMLDQMFLDLGRDDYYGHMAPFLDVQDSRWLVRLDGQVPLRVSVTGPGTVTADVPGLLCTRTCTTTWNADTRLNLTSTPNTSAKLVRWSGACSAAAACSVTVAPGATVSALFAPRVYKLSVDVAGRGSVKTSKRGITCRPRCTASFSSHVPVKLTATAAKGWKLRSWSGACKGKKRACTVPMSKATRARAIFVRA